MDVSSSKRGVGGIVPQKKRPVTVLKDTAGSRNGTGTGTGTGSGSGRVELCKRIGCCGRVNDTKGGNKSKCLEKPKALKPPSLRLSSGKEVAVAGSSRSSVSNVKRPVIGSSEKKPVSRIETVAKKSQIPVVAKTPEVNSLRSRTQSKIKSGNLVSEQNSELNNGRKKRFIPGESSSSGKGKNVIRVPPNDTRVSDPRSSRNLTSFRTSAVPSVKTRRPLNLDTKARSSNQLNRDNPPRVQSTESTESSEPSLSDGGSTSDTSSTMVSVSSTDRSISRFVTDNGARHYNIDGIADVLLALDRMEQDEELTYEQLLSLEANLFLGGLSFYDQHRDMRMDIDNMSYEELLVLEEKMGTVSTALSEEELSKCIKTSVYESLQLEDGRMTCSTVADDSKCSICQEEFVRGDKLGKLLCGHGYHAPCINQWLQLKNWCPICKSSPKPSSSHNA